MRGQSLFDICASFPEVKPVAVCDRNPDTAELPGLPEGIKFFSDFNKMYDSGLINAVLIESPPHFHATAAISALQRNIHVLSDVPAVHTISEGFDLYAAVMNSNALYVFGENVNYWAFVDECAALKQKGLLGDPVYLEAEYVHDIGGLLDLTPWRNGYEPIRYCTHSLGPILKWVDEDLVSVSCFDTGSHIRGNHTDHDAMVAIFRTRTNVVVKVLCTFVNSHPYSFHRYVYYGTRGYFERTSPSAGGKAETLFSSQENRKEGLISLPVDYSRPGADTTGGHGGSDGAMLRDFVDAVVRQRPSPINVREALRMSLPGLYALESAKKGGEMTEITYPWDTI